MSKPIDDGGPAFPQAVTLDGHKKYEFTGETKTTGEVTVHQIRRLKDGAIGGWIEAETNLRHGGDAWVSDNAMVFGNAEVFGDAMVFGNAEVFDDAEVFGDAMVFGNAEVFDDAEVFGDAKVSDNARVSGDAEVFGNARVSGDAEVFGNARVSGDAEVFGNAEVSGPLDFLHVVGLRFSVTIRNDGFASIGCQTRTIAEWLAATFEQQRELTDRAEFDATASVLRPLLELFQARFEAARKGDDA